MAAQSLLIVDVFREQYSELYRTLVKADTSRRLVAIDLYSKNIITEHEHDKIKEIEKLHGADESTDEMLRRIKAHLGMFPTKISKVLEVLGREKVLVPIVTSMKTKLVSEPAVGSKVAEALSVTSSEPSPQSGIVLKYTVPHVCSLGPD